MRYYVSFGGGKRLLPPVFFKYKNQFLLDVRIWQENSSDCISQGCFLVDWFILLHTILQWNTAQQSLP